MVKIIETKVNTPLVSEVKKKTTVVTSLDIIAKIELLTLTNFSIGRSQLPWNKVFGEEKVNVWRKLKENKNPEIKVIRLLKRLDQKVDVRSFDKPINFVVNISIGLRKSANETKFKEFQLLGGKNVKTE